MLLEYNGVWQCQRKLDEKKKKIALTHGSGRDHIIL